MLVHYMIADRYVSSMLASSFSAWGSGTLNASSMSVDGNSYLSKKGTPAHILSASGAARLWSASGGDRPTPGFNKRAHSASTISLMHTAACSNSRVVNNRQ